MQTNIAAMLNIVRGSTLYALVLIMLCTVPFCYADTHANGTTTCRDAIECSGQGYCLQNNTCLCNPGVGGSSCNRCLANHFSYPTCTYCKQEVTCSGNGGCTDSGKCFCNSAFNGTLCDRCAEGFYGYPKCTGCSKQLSCSNQGSCSATGACECFRGWTGTTCNQCTHNRSLPYCDCDYPLSGNDCDVCAPNHYDFPNCVECTATETCSGKGKCSEKGKCICNANIQGSSCDQCSPGFYNYPACIECDANKTCNGRGTCNSTGGCTCNDEWTGTHCEQAPYYTSYSNTANVSSVLVGDPSVFQSSVLSKYDNTIEGLTGATSRSQVRSARATSQFVVTTKLYAQLPCTSSPAQYIQRLKNIFNGTQINNLLTSNGFAFAQTSGSNINAINLAVSCDATATGSNSGSTNAPPTIPPVIKSNNTAPPLPGRQNTASPTPTPANSSAIDAEQVDKLQSDKKTAEEETKAHRDIRLGVGLGLGIGVPFLIAAMVAVYFFATRKPRESYA